MSNEIPSEPTPEPSGIGANSHEFKCLQTSADIKGMDKPIMIEETLDTLCGLFQDELERQELVLAVLRSQQEAALAQDAPAVESKTAALQALIEESVHAEGQRHPVLRRVVEHYALPVERQTLSELIRVTPEPWRSRITDFQTRIRATVAKTQALVRENGGVFRRSLKIVDECLDILDCAAKTDAARYDAHGIRRGRVERGPIAIDARG